MRVEPSALESDRFGVRFARLEQAAAEGLAEALAEADAEGVDVISVRIDASDLPLVRDLEDHGFRIMDTLVYHRLALPFAGSASSPNHAVVPLTADDAPACSALALRAFRDYLGHYHADPRLSNAAADATYADWIARLVTDAADGQVALGVKEAGRLTGFLVGRRDGPGVSDIVLNAVDPESQRGGVYTAMLQAYLAHRSAEGDREVVISTQLQNYAVQRAWSRAGFTLYRSFHTLHRWRPAN